MNHTHKNLGAVIMGGGFANLEMARNLDKYGIEVCLLGSATSVARFSRSISQFVKLPRELQDEELLDFLEAVAEKHGVRGWVLFPGIDEHLRMVTQHQERLAKYFVVAAPPWEMVKHFYDKRLTYALAQQAGIPMPYSYMPENVDQLDLLNIEFPVVLKPAVTPHFVKNSNRKAYLAKDRRELREFYEAMAQVIPPSEVIVQEFLPEPSKNLFSFAGYFKQGEPIIGLSVKRTRQFPRDFGRASSFVEAVELPELGELASRLLRAIHYTGLAEVEFMWSVQRARFELLEVNARFWAWHALAIAAGLDLPYFAFAEALGLNAPVGTVHQGTKWVRPWADIRAAAQEIRSGTLDLRQYLNSLRGKTAFSLFSLSDPIPFIVEPFLLVFYRLRKWTSHLRRSRTSSDPPG